MPIDQLLVIGCTFGAVVLAGYFVSQLLATRGEERHIRDRLRDKPRPGPRPRGQGVMPLLYRIGQAAAEPFMPKTREKQSGVRQNLARAGIYSPSAVKLVTGCKVIFLCVGLLAGYGVGLATGFLMLGLSLGGLCGYMLPVTWLRVRIKSNQRDLTYGLADALDLMVVCVESGLTVDAAMQRVGQELSIAHPALSRELGIAHMETRVGLARTEALRVHAESLRAARQFAAEEQAARASVKMSFPLVLFIFPATFIILAGPTVLKMMQSPLFN